MRRHLALALALLVGWAAARMPLAAPAGAQAQEEIDFLLDDIGASGCEFYRNGRWFDAKRAQAHVRQKYQRLAAADRIRSAEDFIDLAATKSSLSGEAYRIRCAGRAEVPVAGWLRQQLGRLRAGPEPQDGTRSGQP